MQQRHSSLVTKRSNNTNLPCFIVRPTTRKHWPNSKSINPTTFFRPSTSFISPSSHGSNRLQRLLLLSSTPSVDIIRRTGKLGDWLDRKRFKRWEWSDDSVDSRKALTVFNSRVELLLNWSESRTASWMVATLVAVGMRQPIPGWTTCWRGNNGFVNFIREKE